MPEGPSIVILKEAVQPFVGRKVLEANGSSTKLDFKAISGQKIIAFKSWGKHFLICFPKFTIRIHLLMFGSYRINDPKDEVTPRLSLNFSKGHSLNFYACGASLLERPEDTIYDWQADVMNDAWDGKKALQKLNAKPKMLVCDALLDQQIFAGVGNIIKNEVLFRVCIHPESKLGAIPLAKKRLLVKETVHYSFQFLEWKKAFTLKKHWLAHTKKICPRDEAPLVNEYLGLTKRRTFYCEVCQVLYQ